MTDITSDLAEEMAADAATMGENTTTLEALGLEALEVDAEIARLNEELDVKKKALRDLLERKIPEAMNIQGLPEFGFEAPTGGTARLKLDIKVVGTIANVEDMDDAVAYLEESGFTGGVKTTIAVDFTEAEKEAAMEMMDNLSTSGKHVNISRGINPATLRSFARRAIAADPAWDFERVGLTALTAAKFTKRK